MCDMTRDREEAAQIAAAAHAVAAARAEMGWSIDRLAQEAGVAVNSVVNVEHGRRTYGATRHKVLKALGIDPRGLVTRLDDTDPNASPVATDGRNVSERIQVVLDLPGDVARGKTPAELERLRRLAEAEWLRAAGQTP